MDILSTFKNIGMVLSVHILCTLKKRSALQIDL